jgi:hypothetical protein
MIHYAKIEQEDQEVKTSEFLINSEDIKSATDMLLQSYPPQEIKTIKEVKNASIITSEKNFMYLITYNSSFEEKPKKMKVYVQADKIEEAIELFKEHTKYYDDILTVVKTGIIDYIS